MTIKVFYISDVHVPYHDVEAVEKTLDAIRTERPSHVILGGDIVDFYKVSSHVTDPLNSQTFWQEVNQVKDFLKAVMKASRGAEVVYIEGNHENRFTRFINTKAPELADYENFSIKSILDLDAFGIRWVSDTERFWIEDFMFAHGHEMQGSSGVPGNNARKGIMTYGSNYIQGHVHKANVIRLTQATGTYVGVENPCLCDMNPGYVKGFANWQQGFTILELDAEGIWQVRQVILG